MRPWIETKKFWCSLDAVIDDESRGENWRLRRLTPDKDALDRFLDRLIAEFNAEQWEIKAVIPIDRGRVYQEIAPQPPAPVDKKPARGAPPPPIVIPDSYGLGWGTSVLWSVCLIAQRTTWLTDEEYAAKIKVREDAAAQIEAKAKREEAEKANAAIDGEISQLLVERQRLADMPVTLKKALFGKSGWYFRGDRFGTEAEAEAARASALAGVDAKVADLEAKRAPIV